MLITSDVLIRVHLIIVSLIVVICAGISTMFSVRVLVVIFDRDAIENHVVVGVAKVQGQWICPPRSQGATSLTDIN